MMVHLQVPVRGSPCINEPLSGCRLKCPYLVGIIVVVIVVILMIRLMVMVTTTVDADAITSDRKNLSTRFVEMQKSANVKKADFSAQTCHPEN